MDHDSLELIIIIFGKNCQRTKKMIAEKKLKIDLIQKMIRNKKNQKHTYSINLKDIPIILLDKTTSINIVYYEIIARTNF